VRMQAFVDDLDRSGEKHSPEQFKDFRETLEEINDKARHPSPRYFILKSIILNNLYGGDIMEEATEICKLRLFLKLVAQVNPGDEIEPLPDIDFNIRAGNTLVGFVTRDEVKRAIGSKLDFDNTLQDIEEKAELVERHSADSVRFRWTSGSSRRNLRRRSPNFVAVLISCGTSWTLISRANMASRLAKRPS
jgi:hypothetical protein